MDLLKLMEDRYSVRKYKSDSVPQECVDKILLSARLAPTAHNNQPQEIIVVRREEGRALLRKCTECHYDAPLAFIVCYDKNRAWKRSYDGACSGETDAAIVTAHMMLEAQSLGLGTTWVMYFIPEAVKTEFALGDNLVPAAILLAGYADMGPAPAHASRRDTDEYVTYR